MEYLDCAMTSTPSNYKSVHDNRFHGDEDFDPRSDLSQGRGDDAKHPTIIPMYTRAYAIGPKVNSLLSESSLSACKTWMVLQARTLFILRYTRGDHGEPKDQGQACAEAKEGEGRRHSCYRPQTSGPSPDIRPDPRISGLHHKMHLEAPPTARTSGHMPRTSGSSRKPGNPAPSPDIRPRLSSDYRSFAPPARTSGPQPGHPAPPEAPDIRPVARTSSSVCLRTVKGRGPCTPSTP